MEGRREGDDDVHANNGRGRALFVRFRRFPLTKKLIAMTCAWQSSQDDPNEAKGEWAARPLARSLPLTIHETRTFARALSARGGRLGEDSQNPWKG